MTNLRTTCDQAIAFIFSQQQDNGGFLSNEFSDTTFYAGLIASTLSAYEHATAVAVRERAVNFLLAQCSSHGAYNYWARGTAQVALETYPDDFDDTCIALQVIQACAPERLTEKMIADVTRLLMDHEQRPGGPYQTWINAPDDDRWQDIDIVVNSNIAFFLSSLGISLLPLEQYFDEIILGRDLSSKYYCHDIIVAYFLSRVYKGTHTDVLKERVLRYRNKEGYWDNPLHTALAVTTLLRLGIDTKTLQPAIDYLTTSHVRGKWPSVPFFIESITGTDVSYSSCDAHVSACCIEAVLLYERMAQGVTIPSPYVEVDMLMLAVRQQCQELFADSSPLLKAQLEQSLSLLEVNDPSGEIVSLAYRFAQAMRPPQTIAEQVILALATMNVLGWMGYSIYDKLLDGEDRLALLPFANVCAGMVSRIAERLVPHAFHGTVQRIVDGIASATAWEYAWCRLEKTAGGYRMPDAYPEYDQYQHLAAKSLGHALGPIIICMRCNAHDQAAAVEQFFRHYLIARQLSDDAHDWLDDLRNGYLNGVSATLVQEWHATTNATELRLTEAEESLQELFWHRHIDRVHDDILRHCDRARAALKKITLLQEVTFLENLLTPLAHSARQAVRERDRTERFLSAIAT